jgi:hypothetical protein
MTYRFDDAARAGVLGHMNGDHAADNLLIARAFAPSAETSADISTATMTDFDGDGGTWRAETAGGEVLEVTAAWPGGSITERPEVRREIVALYDEACRRLGITPRPHA